MKERRMDTLSLWSMVMISLALRAFRSLQLS